MNDKKNVLLEFSMTPLDKGESVSEYVARSLEIIDKSGLDYRLNPMGTVIEGSWQQVMQIMTQCYEKMATDCQRISVYAKIDYRHSKTNRLQGKIASIEQRLGKEVKK